MSSKETRFSYVYKSLKCRITERLLLPGSRLPSSRVLKDEYQVSLFTINKVLAALREEGLIETGRSSTPTGRIFPPPACPPQPCLPM